jgi:hypothetical protein
MTTNALGALRNALRKRQNLKRRRILMLLLVLFVQQVLNSGLERRPWTDDLLPPGKSRETSSASGVGKRDILRTDVPSSVQAPDPWQQPPSRIPILPRAGPNQSDNRTELLSSYDKYTFFNSDNECMEEASVFSELKESDILVKEPTVKNSLKNCLSFWKDILQPSNEEILWFIENGYTIPFSENPASFELPNNKSALKNKEFVDLAIQELLDKNCAYEVFSKPRNVNPLSVAENSSGKKRLILDLSVLNGYVKKDYVKFEDFKVAKEYLMNFGFMKKFDLKSGYHHLSVCDNQHTYFHGY